MQAWHGKGLGCSRFARRYCGNHFCFLFLGLLRCISSPRFLYPPYIFRWEYPDMTQDGFPHSDIHGSKVVCTSPWLIAAYHVLLRLHVPRHSPYALSSFTKRFFSVEFDYLHQSHCQKAWLVELDGIKPTTFPIQIGTLSLHRIRCANGNNSTNLN